MAKPARKLGCVVHGLVGVLGWATLVACNPQDTGGTTGTGTSSPTSIPTSCTANGPNATSFSAKASFSTSLKKPASHIPKVVSQYSDLGKMSDDANLSVTIALKLNNEDELNSELEEIYTPGNAHYHQFLSQVNLETASHRRQTRSPMFKLISHSAGLPT